MIEGFWIVQFGGMEGMGSGVAVLLKGQVLGGDNAYTYVGTYEGSGSDYRANIEVKNFDPSIGDVMGIKGDYTLNLVLKLQGDQIHGEGSTPSAPGFNMRLKLTRRASLL